ncbi:hypothetical protein GIB67_002900 [Kingdonia uniflora]|uniref:Uncharacterized protein n=1 Tax=Kingdonia uniflora TaxID=39325 RepID=A0A7J7NEJ1_9MAGN|nr:hypothetical protein GIB67_002900 [Kingdonia uniflora]
MKSDKEVNEQVDVKNQTQEGRAKKGTSNAKNYTSWCTGLGLHKIFTALPEEMKHMRNFKMRRFPKKKNTYGLKEIDDALNKQNWKDIRWKAVLYHLRYSTPWAVPFSTPEKTMKHYGGCKVAKTDIVFFNQEEVVGEAYQASADQTTPISVEEQTLEASTDQTAAVSVEEQTIEVTQTEESKESKEEVEQNKEEVVEGKDDDDGIYRINQTLSK